MSTTRKTCRSRVESQRTQPTYGIESGNRSQATLVEDEYSHHCDNPARPKVMRSLPPVGTTGSSIFQRISYFDVSFNSDVAGPVHIVLLPIRNYILIRQAVISSIVDILLKKIRFMNNIFLFIEPHSPPGSVRGHNTSSTSILVQWDNVPSDAQNGIILRYTVYYKVSTNGSVQSVIVSSPSTQVTLTGLKKYTNYSIWVLASTVKGKGNASVPIIVSTDEDSKFPLALRQSIIYLYKLA